MTYKEKHFAKAFGPLMMSALMILPSGCGRLKGDYRADSNAGGLLDPEPIEQNDNYGGKVKLSHVQIPVYSKQGERLKDRWVLTRGIADTRYTPEITNVKIRGVHLNDSPELSYVRVDDNGAVLIGNNDRDSKACGLFVVGEKVTVISDVNVDKFVGERNVRIIQGYFKSPKNKQNVVKDTTAVAPAEPEIEKVNAENTDSFNQQTDTVKNINISTIKPDTLSLGD